MIRWVTLAGGLWLLLAAQPADLFGQVNPYGNAPHPYQPAADPRARRANRERAVDAVGPITRDFVETHGDEAVAAIFACSKPVAEKLAEFFASGEMSKLPRPRSLLYVIAQPRHGDDVALWAMQHVGELADPDSFDAYLLSPLDYALDLKQLNAGAAEMRARRLHQAAMTKVPLSTDEKLALLGGIGFFVIVGILVWRRRQASMW
jgi:hypothetical protein